ncbi:MAG: hypothetical protein JWO89_2509 [Verrucomicrobiaceae bacterium]|nr:hypothetical protein [Verrucomicrobiaceae bacterium]
MHHNPPTQPGCKTQASQRDTTSRFHSMRMTWFSMVALAAASVVAAPSASAITLTDDFTGGSGGVPAAWTDFGPDLTGPVVEGGGLLTISDGRGNNGPHLLINKITVGPVTGFTMNVDIASMTSFAGSDPTATVAVGAFNGYAVVVQFSSATKKFMAFINAPTQGRFTIPGSLPSYNIGDPLSFTVTASLDRMRITSPTDNYDSGDILFSSAPVAGFNSLADIGTNTGFVVGTESGGSVPDGTLATVAFDRLTLNFTPVVVAPPPAGAVSDAFSGNSGGVPSGWADVGQDTNPASTVVENGGAVTITDTRGNGGPQFIQSTTPIGALTAFNVDVNIASMTSFSGSRPEAIIALGTLPPNLDSPHVPNYLFIVLFDAVTKNFKVLIAGPTVGSIELPGMLPSYTGGALSFSIAGTSTGFRITSPTNSYDSGTIPYTAVIPTGFSPAALGANPALILGAESDGQVLDGTRASVAFDQVVLNVTPVITAPPVANAGPDQSVNESQFVTLDGTLSSNPGTGTLTYSWSQISGLPVVLSDASAANPTFTAPMVTAGGSTLTFQVTVTANGKSAVDTVNIAVVNVNHLPVADAGPDQTVAEGAAVTLHGEHSFDIDADVLTYTWTQVGNPSFVLTGPSPAFAAPFSGANGAPGVVGTLTFVLSVDDGSHANVTDSVTISITNVNNLPTARAGADQTATEFTTVTLNGSASTDPDGDALSYTWTRVDNPAVVLQGATPTFTAPAGGSSVEFQLTVNDGYGGSSTDRVIVNAQRAGSPPIVTGAQPTDATLWPPNHGLTSIGITGVSNSTSVKVTSVTQDESTNGLGDGDTAVDAVINNNGTVLLRSERSGTGNGRVYHVHFTASNATGSASGMVKVSVPHGKKTDAAIDGGELFDSTH